MGLSLTFVQIVQKPTELGWKINQKHLASIVQKDLIDTFQILWHNYKKFWRLFCKVKKYSPKNNRKSAKKWLQWTEMSQKAKKVGQKWLKCPEMAKGGQKCPEMAPKKVQK